MRNKSLWTPQVQAIVHKVNIYKISQIQLEECLSQKLFRESIWLSINFIRQLAVNSELQPG